MAKSDYQKQKNFEELMASGTEKWGLTWLVANDKLVQALYEAGLQPYRLDIKLTCVIALHQLLSGHT